MYRSEDRFAEWTAAERADYAASLKAPRAGQVVPAPALVRETLLALGGDGVTDDDVARELARVPVEPGPAQPIRG